MIKRKTFKSCSILLILIFLIYLSFCFSECENGCSGHGKCTLYDMCICYRNWQGNDCSDRICQFGLAFVDSPKGDLDSSNTLDQDLVAVNSPQYPYGTTEEFPNMQNSDLERISQSAHWYTECSSVGTCNRLTGECECYPGFEGVSCHRMKCPGEDQRCSGHGICQTLHNIATINYVSDYALWDRDTTTACVCDPGFYGFDCSMRNCPKGVDPLYYDDVRTIQYPFYFIALMTTSPSYDLTDGAGNPGYFSLVLYDEHGQRYMTQNLQLPVTCSDLISAIEQIPNDVVRAGQTVCYHNGIHSQNAITSDRINITYAALYRSYFSGIKMYIDYEKPALQEANYVSLAENLTSNSLLTGDLFLLQFYGRPGKFREPEIDLYTNGNRPTIVSRNGVAVTATWTNGQQGIDYDFFPTRCDNVQVKLVTVQGNTYFWGAFVESNLLKCLQGSDFNDTNNLEAVGYTYDIGSIEFPHVVKIVRTVSDHRDGNYYVAFYLETNIRFDSQSGEFDYTNPPIHNAFRVLHPAHGLDEYVGALFDVYVTRGVLHRIQSGTRAEFDFGSNHIYLRNISSTYSAGTTPFTGEIGCDFFFDVEGVGQNTSTLDCIDNQDYFFLIDPYTTLNNPPFLNLYNVESIRKVTFPEIVVMGDYDANVTSFNERKTEQVLITTNYHINALSTLEGGTNFQIYRFIPDYSFVYEFHSECSGRGICNGFEGICDCFPGYTGNACDYQDALQF